MASPVLPVVIASGSDVVNPDVGGGDQGAPLVDAARPKPSDGESTALATESPCALAVVVDQQRPATAAPATQSEGGGSQRQAKPDVKEDFGPEPEVVMDEYLASKVQIMAASVAAEHVVDQLDMEKALVPYEETVPQGRDMKRGKVEAGAELAGGSMEQQVLMEATGLGAAGDLTGPSLAPRQEQ